MIFLEFEIFKRFLLLSQEAIFFGKMADDLSLITEEDQLLNDADGDADLLNEVRSSENPNF
jgi:hypothetical protein